MTTIDLRHVKTAAEAKAAMTALLDGTPRAVREAMRDLNAMLDAKARAALGLPPKRRRAKR